MASGIVLGAVLAGAYITRPTNAPFALLMLLYLVLHTRLHAGGAQAGRSQSLPVLGSFLLVLSIFSFWSYQTYGSLLPPYYQGSRLLGSSTFIEALVGNLISPARGLFVFSPIFVFSIWGAVMLWRQRAERPLSGFLLLAVLFHTIAVSLLPHWWGGFAYGPRFMSDLIPLLMYFLLPVAARLVEQVKNRRVVTPCLFLLAAGISFWIHAQGATNRATQRWDRIPRSIDEDPSRLWDWLNPPFLARKER
jgi:hypothetical protein